MPNFDFSLNDLREFHNAQAAPEYRLSPPDAFIEARLHFSAAEWNEVVEAARVEGIDPVLFLRRLIAEGLERRDGI
jgi:hypothetical protein